MEDTTMNAMKTAAEFPVKFAGLMMETMKRSTELSMSYVQGLEKNNREFMKASYDLMNVALPGENKIWEAQTQMVEKAMKMYEDSYEKMMSAVKI
jgi:hypothetical protein